MKKLGKGLLGIVVMIFGGCVPAFADLDAANTSANTAATRVTLGAMDAQLTALRASLAGVAGGTAETAAVRVSLGAMDAQLTALRVSLGSIQLSLNYAPRPDQGTGRTYVTAMSLNATSLSTTSVTLYTVTGGKTFYVQSVLVSFSDATDEQGNASVRDGTTAKIPFQFSGGTAKVNGQIPFSFPTPIRFTTCVALGASTDNVKVALTVVGYEE